MNEIVPYSAVRTLTGEVLGFEGRDLVFLDPASGRTVMALDLSLCDGASIEARRGVGSAAVDRVIAPLAPALAAGVPLVMPHGVQFATCVLVAAAAYLAMWASRRAVHPALVLRRGAAERVVPLALGTGTRALLVEVQQRMGIAALPIRNPAELDAAKQRIARYAAWSGARLEGRK